MLNPTGIKPSIAKSNAKKRKAGEMKNRITGK